MNSELKSYKQWQSNLKNIKQSNSYSANSFKNGLTSLSYLSPDEFKNKMLMSVQNTADLQLPSYVTKARGSFSDFISNIFNPVPSSFNWVDKGLVTSIKYQANCGSCYAFAIVFS